MLSRFILSRILPAVSLLVCASPAALSAPAGSLELRAEAEVDAQGIFLNQILSKPQDETFANVMLDHAPAWGETRVFEPAEINRLLSKVAPHLARYSITGAPEVRVARESRKLEDRELLPLLVEKLHPRGTQESTDILELSFLREWKALPVPSGTVDLRILDMPTTGLASHMMLRFEVVAGEESIGIFPAFVKAHLFRDVWVARSTVRRGTALNEADLARERRDVLGMRDPCWMDEVSDPSLRLKDGVAAGAVLLARFVEPRPVIHRNDFIQAIAKDQFLTVAVRAQALEDGAIDDVIRARNIQNRKEIYGKVINDSTILISN